MFGKSPERVVGTLFKFNGRQLLIKDPYDIANIKAVTDAIHLATGKCFTFTDLAHMFCSVPISTASQLELAFPFAGLQHTFTWLSWGTLTALLSHTVSVDKIVAASNFPQEHRNGTTYTQPFSFDILRIYSYRKELRRREGPSPHM